MQNLLIGESEFLQIPLQYLLFDSDLAELRMGSDNCRADVVNLVHVLGEIVGDGLACGFESYCSLGDIDDDGYRVGFSTS